MKNDGRNTQQLQVGDIVVVKKQVISKEDKPAKLQLKTRGPYKILEKIRNSYRIQRIPTIEGINRKPGKITTEAAHRLTKLPSTIVIHKRMDTIDTKLLARRAELCDTPLETALGPFDFGRFHVNNNGDHAFVKISEMWDEEIEEDSDSDTEETEEAETVTTERTALEQEAETETQYLRRLAREFQQSRDKMAFIQRENPNETKPTWHLVQVDDDETNYRTARRTGPWPSPDRWRP